MHKYVYKLSDGRVNSELTDVNVSKGPVTVVERFKA
jgi:hypothetical protein